jgi:ElaA protein
MTLQIVSFTDLSTLDFHDMTALRIAVFVVEQNCPYMELDGKDKAAFHLLVKNDQGMLVGTLRILKAGVSYPEVSIGRVASHPNHRHEKLGHFMMKEAMEFIRKTMQNPSVRISAQSHLCDFYAQYGFVKTGKEYLEDDIPHAEMLFTPQT